MYSIPSSSFGAGCFAAGVGKLRAVCTSGSWIVMLTLMFIEGVSPVLLSWCFWLGLFWQHNEISFLLAVILFVAGV
ncbi:hypothetical protein D3C76_1739650 [compost metagenome]